jgi:hypothetical protein
MEKVCEQYEKERDRYKKKMNETDDMYIFSSVRDSISKLFNDSKFGKDKDDNEPNYGLFIMVYKKRIFLVEPNMAFIEVDDIATCGNSHQQIQMCPVPHCQSSLATRDASSGHVE